MAPPSLTQLRGESEEGGRHWRIYTPNGPVHLWVPRGYDAITAGVVFYVHGWFTTSDRAWVEHRLAAQFAGSKRNALFVVPEAPRNGTETVFWPSLAALQRTAFAALKTFKRDPPRAPHVVVIAHSGGWRTASEWLDDDVDHLILLDALYGDEQRFAGWIDAAERTPDGDWTRMLTLVAWDTLRWSEPFVQLFGDVVSLLQVPSAKEGFSPDERAARILYMLSQFTHMGVVTDGKAIPVLLQRPRLPWTRGR